MRKKTGILIIAALVLGTIYVLKFTDWFGAKSIQILFTNRNSKVFFGLDGRKYQVSSIKVYRADDFSTNKYPHPLWNLVATSEKNAPEISDFVYGEKIGGMKPAVPGTVPENLQKGEKYHIVVESGKIKGERDFQIH